MTVTGVESRRFDNDGLVLVGDGYGSPGATPVLLAHGGGQTRHSWGGTAALLARAGWYAMTVDLRGHGDSEWSPAGDYELQHFAGDLRTICATLEAAPVMVGASLGGLSSLLAIAEAPDPAAVAAALVLVDVAPRIELAGVDRIRAFMNGHPRGFASLDDVADAVAAYNPHRPRPRDLDGLRKNVRLRADGRWYWHWDPRFIADDADEPRSVRNEPRLEAAARSLELPTLLVRGARSDLLSEEGARHFRQLVPHVEVADIAGAGHMVAGDRNDVFNEAIVAFLDRVVGRRPPASAWGDVS